MLLLFWSGWTFTSNEGNIDVATLGITREQAKAIKTTYQEIRDRILSEEPRITKVNLIIEPLDEWRSALGRPRISVFYGWLKVVFTLNCRRSTCFTAKARDARIRRF